MAFNSQGINKAQRILGFISDTKEKVIPNNLVFMLLKHIIAHTAFWLVLMLTYAASEWGYRNNFQEAMVFEFLYLPIRMIAVYVNWYVLIPKYLYKNRIGGYLFSLLFLLFLLAIAQRFLNVYWGYPNFFSDWFNKPIEVWVFFRIIQNLVILASPVAFSTGIKFFMDWYEQKNKANQLAMEKRAAELKYLKAQINPHFLFNTLNNLYGLSLENSQKVPQLILKLSDFLSYSLYDSAVEKLPLRKEIKLITDFIDLEKERYEGRLELDWQIEATVDQELAIAPLLLMPLVENAFKHGVKENIAQTKISIHLAQMTNELQFKIINTISVQKSEQRPNGIGLKNLKRRLDLLYLNKYQLDIKPTKQQFTAILKLQIDE